MKKVLMMLCAVMLVFGMVGSASATVLTFDDFTTTTSYEAIPDGYGGFNWDNATTIMAVNGPIHAPGSGYEHGAVSGNYTAFNCCGRSPSRVLPR